jgi:hypothetical protein
MHTLTADSVCTSPVRAAMQCYAVLQRTGLQTATCVLWLSADDTAYCLAHSVYMYIGCAYSNTVGVLSTTKSTETCSILVCILHVTLQSVTT